MADFKTAYLVTQKFEGGYVSDPDDIGGETYKGVARRFNGNWDGWTSIDKVTKVTNSTEAINALLSKDYALQTNVMLFYKKNYWDVNSLDKVQNQKIAAELFDTGVNMGPQIAAEFVQRSLNALNRNQTLYKNIVVDRVIGPVTISLINSANAGNLLKCLNGFQFMRYITNIEKNEVQEKFFNSWLSRVEF